MPELQFLNLPQIDAAVQQQKAAQLQNALAPYVMQKYQMDAEKGNLEMQMYREKVDREKRIRDALQKMTEGEMAAHTSAAPVATQAPTSYAPGGENSPKIGGPDWLQAYQAQSPQQPAPQASATSQASQKQAVMQRFMKQAEIYAVNGDADTANKMYEHAIKAMPEVKEIRVEMDNGKPVNVIYFRDGSHQVSPFGATPNIHWADNGQKTAIALNGYTGEMIGGGIQKQVTPDALLTDQRTRSEGSANRAVTIRGQNLTDARAKEANTIQSGNRQQQGVIEIRKEFNALPEVKNFKEVLPIIQSVQHAPDTPAGDIDIIYGVGKVMDPNSVVREGELNMVIKSGSPMQRFQGMLNYVKGGGRLTPDQRAELISVMQSRVDGLKTNYDTARTTYETAAERQGLPKEQIFIESAPPQKPASNQSGSPLAMPTKKESLVAGQTYRTPRGVAKWNGTAFEAQ